MSRVSVVVPAYNEAESLPHLWDRLRTVLQSYPDWEVVIVSDGSTDQTNKIVERFHQTEPRIRLVALRRNRGKSAALMAGFKAVTGDQIITIDADLQDDPDEIPNLLRTMSEQDVDLVGGWKQKRKDPLVKLISSRVFNGIANRIMGTNFRDLNCGLKAYRREVVDSLDLYGDLYRFIPLLAVAQGWKATEIPVQHHARQWGVSKYGLRLSGLFDLISLLMITKYRWRPLHFFGRWGALLFLIGLIMLGYLTAQHFMGMAIGNRPLLIFGVLFCLVGLQLLFTGLLGDLILQTNSRAKK